ncbi:tetratricopeptide repeat protein [Methylomonas paludis]|uniref:tetratricopeptide repeat protein n=1 Tax=Methylomonas paludis TaxID=1173101 RepID=UPI001FE5BB1B|nr:tetratricopeptide repeat protein [Methylomonas paludis]
MKKQYRSALFLVLATTLIAIAGYNWLAKQSSQPVSKGLITPPISQTLPSEPKFVGVAVCSGCHADQTKHWQGSHHDLAMQEANERTVLGDFNQAEFKKDDVVSQFFRRDGHYFVKTDGTDGKLTEFEVKYTFGVSPLQQYLLELPGGRLQALSIAWDSRSAAQGGQHWFHLYPNEKIDHTDELHWTKPSQNWNYMCAECHSTKLEKNYDQASQTYNTQWAEINVACEACHGPGSGHVDWAQAKDRNPADDVKKGLTFKLDEHHGVNWGFAPGSDNANRSEPRTTSKEIEVCARCHSRRGQLFTYDQKGEPLLDTHLPGLLRETLYHADGQIDGEVYEYGSFLQSKMHQAGVSCSDCHEPHSLKLRAEGNGVCLQCHQANKYDSEKHHFHKTGTKGANCVDCHMPTKDYMVVHTRHDHSFRIPRPDLSVKFGTPNACVNCHTDKQATWAAKQLKRWLGHEPQGYQHYAEALHAARVGAVDADTKLVALIRDQDQPGIARATAVSELRRRLTEETFPLLAEALADKDPLVRAGALEALDPLPVEQRWQASHQLLRDPLRVIRALAAEALTGTPTEQLPANEKTDLQQAGADYLAAQKLNADQPGSLVNLGNFYAANGDAKGAEQSFRQALALDPSWVPAYINLSDFYRQTGRDTEGEKVLLDGLALQPKAAALHHSLGLLRIRQKNLADALISLRNATELAPADTHFRYVYALALHSAGRTAEAQTVVAIGLQNAPGDLVLKDLKQQLAGHKK